MSSSASPCPSASPLPSRDASPAHHRPSAVPLIKRLPPPTVNAVNTTDTTPRPQTPTTPRGKTWQDGRWVAGEEPMVVVPTQHVEVAATSAVPAPVAAQPEQTYFESHPKAAELTNELFEPVVAAKEERMATKNSFGQQEPSSEQLKAADVVDASTGAAPMKPVSTLDEKMSLLEEQVERVPLVGLYVSALLQRSLVKSLVEKAAPYVQQGVDMVSPYVEQAYQLPIVQGSIQRFTPVVERGIHRAENTVSALKKLPAVAVAVPGQAYRGIRAAPGQTYRSIAAAPGHACEVATPYAASAADKAQPWVHKSVSILMPFMESIVANARVQSVYQHKAVQGGIQKALPYVKPVSENSRVQAVAEWARPTATAS